MTVEPTARVQRATLTFVSSVGASAATLLLGLVVTPWVLEALGEERFGAFRAATEWLAHLRLLELGLAGATLPLLSGAIARGSPSELSGVVSGSVRAYARAAALMLVAGLLLAAVMPALVTVGAEGVDDLRLGCVLGALAALVYPLTPFQQLAEAEQRGYLASLLGIVQAVVTAALSVALARAGWGIRGQMLALVVGIALPPLLLTARAARAHPGLFRGGAAPPSQPVDERISSLRWPSFVVQVCGRVSLCTDLAVVALLLGPTAVVPLFLTMRLPALAGAQLLGVGNATWAGLADLEARGERATFNARLVELTRLTAVLGAAVLVPIVAWNHEFVRLWVGEARYGGAVVTALAALNAQLHAAQALWGWALTGTGRIRALVPIHGVATALNLGASVTLTLQVGIAGPLLGTTVGLAGCSLGWLAWTLHREFGAPWGRLLVALLVPTAAAAGLAFGLSRVARLQGPLEWPLLALEMAIAGLLVLGLGWALLLTPAERDLWRLRVGAMTARLRGQPRA